MAADRGSAKEIQTKSRVGKVKASSFIFGVTTASLLAGFGLALGRVKRKNPTEFNEVAANKLALKALGYGTVISFCGCGLLILAVKWALGVRSVSIIQCLLRYYQGVTYSNKNLSVIADIALQCSSVFFSSDSTETFDFTLVRSSSWPCLSCCRISYLD